MKSFDSMDAMRAVAHHVYAEIIAGERDVKWIGPLLGAFLGEPAFQQAVLSVVEADGDFSRSRFAEVLKEQDAEILGILNLAVVVALGDLASEHEMRQEERKAA